MGFRFRRSVNILPGLRLNLGKKSASVSVGVRGAHVTLRPGHKARTTVGLPGTGLSYTEGGGKTARESAGAVQAPALAEPSPNRPVRWGFLWIALAVAAVVTLTTLAARLIPHG